MSCSLSRVVRSAARVLVFSVAAAAPSAAQHVTTGLDSLPAALSAKVRAAVLDVMHRTNVPSAQVGIVRNGRIAYVAAFGQARLSPPMPATPDMHYAVGSISKQFTAACVLLLQQDGKLSIDDPGRRR